MVFPISLEALDLGRALADLIGLADEARVEKRTQLVADERGQCAHHRFGDPG